MKGLDGPDGIDETAWNKAWDDAIREDAARRAARLPSKPVVVTRTLSRRVLRSK